MADGFEATWVGLDQALAELREIPQVIATRVLLGAVATGASVIRKEIIRRAPVGTGDAAGNLKRAVYQVRNMQLCTPVQQTFKVGIRQGKRTKKNGAAYADAYYAGWVEFGHFARVPHEMTKTAKAAGRMLGVAKWVPARPFFRPGVASSADAAFAAMRDYIRMQLPLATAAMTYLKAA